MTKKTRTEKKRARSAPPNPTKAAPSVKSARSGDRAVSAGVVAVPPAAPKAIKKPAAAPAKPVSKGAPKAKSEKKAMSSVAMIRQVLANDPEATVETIAAALAKAGLSKGPDTVRTIRSDFHGTYRALQAAGRIKAA